MTVMHVLLLTLGSESKCGYERGLWTVGGRRWLMGIGGRQQMRDERHNKIMKYTRLI